MMKHPIALLPALALALGTLAPAPAIAETCTDQWSMKDGEKVLLYPDLAASYLVYAFNQSAGAALRFSGDFPRARFQSYTVYEDAGGLLVGKLSDVEIQADPGHTNPYLPGADRGDDLRRYSVIVAPEGSPAASLPNAIVVGPEDPLVRIIMRVYLPDPGTDPVGDGRPEIEAIDATTFAPIPCPDTHFGNGADTGAAGEIPLMDEEIHFLRVAGTTAYPSYDTAYLVSPLNPALGEVALVHLQSPTFTDTSSGGGSLTGDEEVRYWSLCLSRLSATTTDACVADYAAEQDRGGEAWVAFGPPTLANRRAARRHGITLVPWAPSVKEPVLLYRNITEHPDFESGVSAVPAYDPDQPLPEQYAELTIGDYAPIGVMCTSAAFQADGCGK